MSEVFRQLWEFGGGGGTTLVYICLSPTDKRACRKVQRHSEANSSCYVGENGKDWPQWLPFLMLTLGKLPRHLWGFPLLSCYSGMLGVLREDREGLGDMGPHPIPFIDTL